MTDQTFTARWVFPVAGPPLAGGVVTVRGDRIVAVEPAGSRDADHDLGNVAVIPGLVNAHTHLDLSGARGLISPTDPDHFTDWLRGVIAYRRSRTPAEVQADIAAGLAESLAAGVTLLGDVTAGGGSWAAVHTAPVRATLLWELIGLTGERFDAACAEWSAKTGRGWFAEPHEVAFPASSLCNWGASPHAPYSVNHDHARALLGCTAGPKGIHLAESPGEMQLLADKTGPFVNFLRDLGVWQPDALTRSAEEFLFQAPQLDSPRLFFHCNYQPPDTAFRSNQSVVFCPRTHATFGHPPHPFPTFLARGVRVALGTDGLTSNPDLDLLAEARFVRQHYPEVPAATVLWMATLAGAEALGWAKECGSLKPGKSADFVAVPLPDRDGADPHDLLFAADAPAGGRRTMFMGTWR